MSDRWFAIAACAGSPFADRADILCDRGALSARELFEADIFLIDEKDTAARTELPEHLLLLPEPLTDAEMERLLLPFPGRAFISRTGHDIVNLFAPLADIDYLSRATVGSRIERGTRMGQQLNLIGHLQQGDLAPGAVMPLRNALQDIADLARQAGIMPLVEHPAPVVGNFLPERIAAPLLREIVDNWRIHSRGEERIVVNPAERTLVFSNRTDIRFPFSRHKAVLRRPYQKFGAMTGNGLGFYLISLLGVIGGFSWDIILREERFSLSLSLRG